MSQSPIYLDINNNKSVITALKAGEEKEITLKEIITLITKK